MKLRSICLVSSIVLVTVVVFVPAPVFAATCESLKTLSLENTTITLAQTVAAGQFSLPATGRGAAQQNAAFKQLPAFCRIAATLSHRVIPISRLKRGCRCRIGTANTRPSVTAGGLV